MDEKKLAKAAQPAKLGDYLQKTPGDHGHHGSPPRETIHNGHEIVLETIYRVTVDGKKVDLGLMVDDQGKVHCHSLPSYQFQSALDMVKAIVDQFPDDFRNGKTARKGLGRRHSHTPSAKPKRTTKKGSRGKQP